MKFNVSPPGAATLISPSGTITTIVPTYTWNAVSDATWYQLYVNDSTGNKIQTVVYGCRGTAVLLAQALAQ